MNTDLLENGSPLVGELTMEEWNDLRIFIDNGLTEYQSQLRRKVGIFIICWKSKFMYIGEALEWPGGLGKRLRDFSRLGESGRSHAAGKLIYDNRDGLTVEVLVTGSDNRGCMIASELKRLMIQLHQPPWNVRRVPSRRRARRRRRTR